MFHSLIYNFNHYLILISVGFMCGFLVFYIFNIVCVIHILLFFTIFITILLIRTAINVIQKKSVSKLCILSILFTTSLICGILRICVDEYKYQYYADKFGSGNTAFYGTVVTEPVSGNTKSYKSAYVRLSYYTKNGMTYFADTNVKLYYTESDFEEIKLLDKIEFYGRVQNTNEKYILKERSENVSSIIKAKTCIKSDFKETFFINFSFAQIIKLKLYEAIENIFYYNPKRAAIARGILTGSKNGFSQRMYDGFSDAGFMHIAAVSGMHVSILLAVISTVFLSLKLHRKVITTITIPLLFIFCAIAGFTASSLRAAIMLSLSLLSMFVDREYDLKTALFFSALVILAVYPYKLFTPSFILSFGATLGIALFYAPIEKLLKNALNRIYIPHSVISSIALSISAFLGTAPFCAAFFGNINFTAILTNIWIIPVVTVIFCLVFAASLIYYIFPWISLNVLNYFCEPLLMIVAETADLFYNTGIGKIEFDYVPSAFYGLYVAFILILYKLIKKA